MNLAPMSLCGAIAVLLTVSSPVPGRAARTAPPAAAPRPLPAPVKVAAVEGITEYRLANGLKVLLFPDPGKSTITVNVTYLVGSRHESYGETGMAHLLEHLVFKGTERFSGENGSRTPIDVLNQLGAAFNGTTFYDHTSYFITFPASAANLEQILDLEAERMGRSLIRAEDLWDPERQRGEMTVVRNEFETAENDPLGVTLDRALAAAFDWHNYGKPVIGCRSDIENVSIERLRAFYRRYYAPDNAVLLVTGRIDEAGALAEVDRRFGRIPRPARILEPTYTREPAQDGERYVAVRRVGETPVLLAGYKVPAFADRGSAAVQVLGRILGGVPSGRLHKGLVETGKAAEAFVFDFGLREPGILFCAARLAPGQDPEEAKAALLRILEGAARAPVTADEVDRARTELDKWIDLTLNQSDHLGLALSSAIGQGDWRLFFLNRDRLRAVRPAEVQAAMERFLHLANRTLAEFIPTAAPVRTEIAPAPDAQALVADYRGQAAAPAGEAFDVAFTAIEARALRKSLPCGLAATVVPRKTRGATVSTCLTLHFGREGSLRGQTLPGRLCASMLLRGSAGRTRQQVKDELDRLKAQVVMGGEAEGLFVTIDTVRENLEAAVRLVVEALRRPTFPEAEFAQLRQEAIAGLLDARSEPMLVAGRCLDTTLTPYPRGHVRHQGTFDEELAAVQAVRLEELRDFHRRFYGPRGELAIVGDVDPGAILDLWNSLLAGWRPEETYQRIPDRPFPVPAQDRTLETPDKANAIYLAGHTFPLRDDDPDYPALLLGDYLLGGGTLKNRLTDRVRQTEGLSYRVGSAVSASAEDPSARWSLYATANPANLGRVQQAIGEELERALRDGFTAREIADAKTSWRQGTEVQRSSDSSLAMQLARAAESGRTLAFDAELERQVLALDSERILAALRRHLDPGKLVVVKAGDFARAGRAGP